MDVSTETASPRPESLPELRVPGLTILAHPDPRQVGERVLLPALSSADYLGGVARLGEQCPLDPHLAPIAEDLALETAKLAEGVVF